MVYFIQSEKGPIKIGATRSVTQRLNSLQNAHPEKLVLLGVLKGGFKLEKRLHKRFEKYHMLGEWYTPHENIKNFIEKNRLNEIPVSRIKQKHNNYLPKLVRILEEVGLNFKLARLRRKFSSEMLSERAGISRPTLRAIEKGDPGVSFGAYANVIFCLQLEDELKLMAKDDILGRKLQDIELLQRAPKRAKRAE